MPRERDQQGYVEETGKKVRKWRGHYFVYVRSEDGDDVRKHRIVTLGLKSELRKSEAEKKLKQIIECETGKSAGKADSNVTLRWFCENRFLPMQVGWRDSTRGAIVFTMNWYVLPVSGDVSLAKLRRFDLQIHLNKLTSKYSKSVVAKARTWTRAILEEAIEQDYLTRNPTAA
jgi:hypothetical protein